MELRSRQRIFLSVCFFLSGVCFSSWTSRIPTIKDLFRFNDAELGGVLTFMPVSSFAGLAISSWLVSKFNTRKPLLIGFIFLATSLCLIGSGGTVLILIISLCLFSFSMRIVNLSINSQSMVLQKQFERKIIGSFHGLWSTGGIVGIGVTTLFIALNVSMQTHLIIVSVTMVVAALIAYPFLLHNDRSTTGNKLIIGKPDPYLAYLGILIFFAGICEGGMFDWSGLYFKEVVGEEIFTLGYLSFMICMTLSRFASDWLMENIGMMKLFILSALLVVSGVLLAVLLPYFWTSLAGFCLAGVGVAAVIPMTLILASGSKKYSPGMAISIVTTYSLVGVFIGPPLVGFIAHAFNLQIGFLFFVLCGLMLIPISQLFFRHQRSVETDA